MRQLATIIACISVSAVLGTIHAFSLFVPEWESFSNANRANVSLIYSLALVALTVAVLFGHRIYARVSPHIVFIIVGFVACAGLLIAALSTTLMSLYISYGILFGGANGVGYGYTLQLAGQVTSTRRGLAMVLVTAFYALGATISPLLFALLIEQGGNSLALKLIAFVVLAVALLAALLVFFSKAKYQGESAAQIGALSVEMRRTRVLFWIGYGCAVTAGLMVIGHAFGIATWMQFESESATLASITVALGNMLGGYTAAYYVSRLSTQLILRYLPIVSIFGIALLMLQLGPAKLSLLSGLSIIGFSYGAAIAVYPVAVANTFGVLSSARIYGQVFTAWGLAGLLGPWVSGWLYDQYGSYTTALLLAALLSMVSSLVVRRCVIDIHDKSKTNP